MVCVSAFGGGAQLMPGSSQQPVNQDFSLLAIAATKQVQVIEHVVQVVPGAAPASVYAQADA